LVYAFKDDISLYKSEAAAANDYDVNKQTYPQMALNVPSNEVFEVDSFQQGNR